MFSYPAIEIKIKLKNKFEIKLFKIMTNFWRFRFTQNGFEFYTLQILKNECTIW